MSERESPLRFPFLVTPTADLLHKWKSVSNNFRKRNDRVPMEILLHLFPSEQEEEEEEISIRSLRKLHFFFAKLLFL